MASPRYQKRPVSSRSTVVLMVAAVTLIAVVVIGAVLWSTRSSSQEPVGDLGATATAVAGTSQAQVVDLFEDALCPACGNFERANGAAIDKSVRAGRVKVRFHMLNFLDTKSHSGDYSTRAGIALSCVYKNGGLDATLRFHRYLYTRGVQPEEGGSTDLSDTQLAESAVKSGAPSARECIGSAGSVAAGEYKKSVERSEAQLSSAAGRIETPSILVNGKAVNISDTSWISPA